MSGLRLTLTSRPPARVDLGPLTAQPLAGRSAAEIAAISLVVGNRRVRLDELFRITGTPGEALEIAGGDDRLDRIGAGLAGGRIVVEGDAGAYLGQRMTGGSITVSGHAGAFAATGMKGGEIRVTGNAGDFLAAAIPGDHQGMQGGLVLVGGNAGDRAGDRMRRGAVLVSGSAGDYCASRMVAGTIAVGGRVGRSTGMAMRRGTVLLLAPHGGLPPTFNDCGRFPLTMLALLARAWRGLPGPFGALPAAGLTVRRFMGDLANDGKGEVLVRD